MVSSEQQHNKRRAGRPERRKNDDGERDFSGDDDGVERFLFRNMKGIFETRHIPLTLPPPHRINFRSWTYGLLQLRLDGVQQAVEWHEGPSRSSVLGGEPLVVGPQDLPEVEVAVGRKLLEIDRREF